MLGKCCCPNVNSDDINNRKSDSETLPVSSTVVNDEINTHPGNSLLCNLKNTSEKLHEQKKPKEMMKKFHKSMKLCIYQCTVS